MPVKLLLTLGQAPRKKVSGGFRPRWNDRLAARLSRRLGPTFSKATESLMSSGANIRAPLRLLFSGVGLAVAVSGLAAGPALAFGSDNHGGGPSGFGGPPFLGLAF